MLRLALRPRWLLMLLLALGVAAAFAALGQWQISRAVDHDASPIGATETLQPIDEALKPDSPLRTDYVGQRVSVTGGFVPGEDVIISERLNGGVPGYWIVGHFQVSGDGGAALAVARGWTESRDAAAAARAELTRRDRGAETEPITLEGRIMPNEAPVRPASGASSEELTTVAIAALVNRWNELGDGPLYRGYLVSTDEVPGLELIDAPPPENPTAVNWLNVFYAIEWTVFAGFAVFLWYRLLRDEYEREIEEAADAAAAAEPESALEHDEPAAHSTVQ